MATQEPTSPPTLAQYPELILGAIEAVDDKNGASQAAISSHIESIYGQLPAAHSTLLSHHLNRMKQSGELVMYKNNYLKPDPTRTSPRGRGRPPKDKSTPATDGAVTPARKPARPAKNVDVAASLPASSPRPRGRPAKDVIPTAASPSPRPRGRPAKIVEPAAGSPSPRPRGRPPKIVDPNAAKPLPRPRGRQPENVNAEAASPSPRPRGRPKNVIVRPSKRSIVPGGAVSSPRPRGRPPKENVDSEGGSESMPSSVSGKKRGRPRKIDESGDETTNVAALPVSGTKRGRGRPPKVKPV